MSHPLTHPYAPPLPAAALPQLPGPLALPAPPEAPRPLAPEPVAPKPPAPRAAGTTHTTPTVRTVVALLAALLSVGVVWLPTTAEAAEPTEATVVLTEVTPTAEVHGQVTLTGTVKNTGTKPLWTVQVMTCRDTKPIVTKAQLDTTLAADPLTAPCNRITAEGSYINVSEGKAFEPGTTSPFTLTANLDDLGFTQAGAYVVGIHVRASADQSANYQTVGRARTLLPVTDQTATAAPVVSVVLMTSRPSFLKPGVLVDDHLATELKGRLLALVRSAQRPNVSSAIDPALYREITTMAAGYVLADGSQGTGRQAAQEWLVEYSKLKEQDHFRLPYGNPDLAFATASNDASIALRSADALAEVPDLAALPLLVRAPNNRADDGFLSYVMGMTPAWILGETTGTTAATLRSPAGQLGAVDQSVFGEGPGPDDRTTTMQRLQRLRTTSFVDSLEGRGTVRVIDNEANAFLDAAPGSAWEQRRTLSQDVPTVGWQPSDSTGPAAGPLTSDLHEPLEKAALAYGAFGDLIGSPLTGRQLAARALAPVPSASWADDQQAVHYMEAVTREVSDLGDGVHLRVSKLITMTSKENQFPVTISNNLTVRVVVKVSFESSNPGRLVIPDSPLVTIAPGESVTVNVNPQAKVTGDVDVVARLVTQRGDPIGAPQKFVIDATEAGKVGWIIVIASGLVLVAATVWRIRQVARSRSRGEEAA